MIGLPSLPRPAGARALALAGVLPLLGACLPVSGMQLEWAPARGVDDAAAPTVISEGSLHILHPYLAARLHALERRSPRLHAEMEALRRGDLLVYLGTEVPVRDAGRGVVVEWRMPHNRIGEYSAVRDPRTGVVTALVARVNLEQIVLRQRRWRREKATVRELRLNPRLHIEEAVDGILIHELWGHLIPAATGRDHGAHCPDPRPGETELASCVMQRENELRAELGMRPRTRYKWSRYARP